MKVVLRSGDGRVAEVDVEPSDLGETLMILAEVEFTIPVDQQHMSVAGRPIMAHQPMSVQNVEHGTVVEVSKTPPQPRPSGERDSAAQRIAELFGGGGAMAPPAAARASAAQDPVKIVADLFAQSKAMKEEEELRLRALRDPDDPEVQRRAYDAIQQQALRENMEQALEYTPEAFSRVVMLYVPAEVNGVHLNAFVDSGAQMTIMSARIADKCNLTRLIDSRFSGTAKGVGTSKILGRVHLAQVKIGGLFLPMSITVLEQPDMDFLLGLDQLKHHQMVIDLRKNALVVGEDATIPFLPEHMLEKTQRGGDDGDADGTSADAKPASFSAEKESKIGDLVALSGGSLDRKRAVALLEATDWNADAAAALLLQG